MRGSAIPSLVIQLSENRVAAPGVSAGGLAERWRSGLERGAFSGMIVQSNKPSLKPLHADSSLIGSKLEKYGKLSDQELIDSLKPGQPGSLKARPDGTIIDGHHRIKILRDRGVDVDSLPRDILPKDDILVPPES